MVNSRGQAVPGTVSYNAATRTATLVPNGTRLANPRYTVKLTGGIKDATGNPLAATSWSFTTGNGPVLSRRTPAPGATGVSRTGNITVK
ncbi:Ig-like domain-containing protein, partial [Arthrobacter deserti]|nr:Ig-like domain-containing protein [Arthrobacter deserti]